MSLIVGVFGKEILGRRLLAAGGGTNATGESGTGTGIGAGTGADAFGDALAETGTGTGAGAGTGADAFVLPTTDIVITFTGDSNGDGRATNNQPGPPDGAWMLNSAGQIVPLADPTAGGTHTYPVLDDGTSSKGSILPRLAQHYYAAGKTTLFVPNCKGGSQTLNWAPNEDTATLYGASQARIDAVGGVDAIVVLLGANDAIGAVSQATFVARANAYLNALAARNPTSQIYLVKVHDFAGYGTQVQTIRAGVQEIWDTNPNVRPGGDMDGITTAVHYTTDAEMIEVAARIYAALTADAIAETGTGTGAGAGSGADATGDGMAETGTGTGAGAGTGADAFGDALAETGDGTGAGAGAGDDGYATQTGGDAQGETGTGLGAGSGNTTDATGEATAESGTGTGAGSGSTTDPGAPPFDATAFLTRLATLTVIARRAIGQPWTVGESARLNLVAADHEGDPYDPETLRLLVKPPAAAVAIYDKGAFTRDAAGIYHIEIPLTGSGNWYYRVEAGNRAIVDGAITVQPSRFVA